MRAYYNENDPQVVTWLRALIAAGVIAAGEVDDRSITDVAASDLVGFTQCHFFAGIGGWSVALRLAGWPDARPVWSGSCPCQPWSAAGEGLEADDPRHLWPAWVRLIAECRPPVLFGEQVAGKAGRAWFDAVCHDLEAHDYAVGAIDLPACSVGAPHIRQRLWLVAHDHRGGWPEFGAARLHAARPRGDDAARRGAAGGVVHGERAGLEGFGWHGDDGDEPGRIGTLAPGSTPATGATRGWWADAEWIPCRDGKARPVEPGTFPLVDGAPTRVLRLRGYGNGIVPALAAEVIKAAREVLGEDPHGL